MIGGRLIEALASLCDNHGTLLCILVSAIPASHEITADRHPVSFVDNTCICMRTTVQLREVGFYGPRTVSALSEQAWMSSFGAFTRLREIHSYLRAQTVNFIC